jgi:hypothetical protein
MERITTGKVTFQIETIERGGINITSGASSPAASTSAT